jgi:uncharacterized protein YceH (UPF0502 family)
MSGVVEGAAEMPTNPNKDGASATSAELVESRLANVESRLSNLEDRLSKIEELLGLIINRQVAAGGPMSPTSS